MGSTGDPSGSWPAQRVRDQFIQYFKDHGHKFGQDSAFLEIYIDTKRISSTIFLRRTARRSYSSLRECWYEPIQVYLSWHRRTLVRLCSIEARRELSEGALGS